MIANNTQKLSYITLDERDCSRCRIVKVALKRNKQIKITICIKFKYWKILKRIYYFGQLCYCQSDMVVFMPIYMEVHDYNSVCGILNFKYI